MTDATAEHAATVLATLALARSGDIPTAMMGQGIGPLDHPGLRARARAVLPGVGLIALREGIRGPALLQQLGVPAGRVLVTGDDAIEAAMRATPAQPGAGLGINIRLSANAGVGPGILEVLRPLLAEEARRRGTTLVPVPIGSDARDAAVLQEFVNPSELTELSRLDTPGKVIAQVGRCRVLLSGAYHAAVFALAQGIPVIGLAETEYYRWKFEGLRALFGEGCEIVTLDEPDLPVRLTRVLAGVWERADAVRDGLRHAAAAQVERSTEAYRRLPALLGETGTTQAAVMSL
jgi:polysaccharide pyruvyl transferase WcaK-like protein